MSKLNRQKEAALMAVIPSPPASGAEMMVVADAVRVALSGTALEYRIPEVLDKHVPNQGRTGVIYGEIDQAYLERLAIYIGASDEDDLRDLPESYHLFVY
jgi:hypothetical protein